MRVGSLINIGSCKFYHGLEAQKRSIQPSHSHKGAVFYAKTQGNLYHWIGKVVGLCATEPPSLNT